LTLLKGSKRELLQALRKASRPTLLVTGTPHYLEGLSEEELEEVYLYVVKNPLSLNLYDLNLKVKEVVFDASPFIEAQGHLRAQLDWLKGYLKATGAKLTLFCPPRYDPRLKREVAAIRWLEDEP